MVRQSLNTISSQKDEGEVRLNLIQHISTLLVHLAGYGSLAAFAWFLVFAAKRYHSVYGWAHGPGRNISPEQFYQSANNANNAILLIVVLAGLLTVRGKYVPGKFIGIFCILICLGLFIHGCSHVGARF